MIFTSTTFRISFIAAAAALALSACGGGGGGGESSAPATAAPAPTAPSGATTVNLPANVLANKVGAALADGLHELWGFNFIDNGVRQVFVSRATLDAALAVTTTKIAGAMNSIETPPSIFDAIRGGVYGYLVASGGLTYPSPVLGFPAGNTDTATVSLGAAGNDLWSIALTSVDVGGQTVAANIKRGDGTLLDAQMAAPGTTFAAGSKAYTATFTALKESTVLASSLLFVNSEATLIGSGFCSPLPGQTTKLGVEFKAANVVSLYSVSSTCDFTGLTPVATGSWSKTAASGQTVYDIAYPEAIVNGTWAPLFTNTSSPLVKAPNRIAVIGSDYKMAVRVAPGEVFKTLQPHFNAAALPALKTAAGL